MNREFWRHRALFIAAIFNALLVLLTNDTIFIVISTVFLAAWMVVREIQDSESP